MSRAIALTRTHIAIRREEILRTVIVTGCALALILAGQPLPL